MKSSGPGLAESLLKQKAAQIMRIQPPHAPPSGSLENIIDAQSAFNSLFVNILKLSNPPPSPAAPPAAAPAPLGGLFGGFGAPVAGGGAVAGMFTPGVNASVIAQQKLSSPVLPKNTFGHAVSITREVMGLCSPELLALFTDVDLSAAAMKTLSRFAAMAASNLKRNENTSIIEASCSAADDSPSGQPTAGLKEHSSVVASATQPKPSLSISSTALSAAAAAPDSYGSPKTLARGGASAPTANHSAESPSSKDMFDAPCQPRVAPFLCAASLFSSFAPKTPPVQQLNCGSAAAASSAAVGTQNLFESSASGAPFSLSAFGSSTLVSSGASSSASFPVSASTPLALGASSSSSTVFGSMPAASGAPSSAFSVSLSSSVSSSNASSPVIGQAASVVKSKGGLGLQSSLTSLPASSSFKQQTPIAGVVNHHFGLVLLWRVHSLSTLLHDLFLFSGMFAAGAFSSNSDWSKLNEQTGNSIFALPTQQPFSTKTFNRAPSQAMQGGFSNLAAAPGSNLFVVGGAIAPAPSPAFGGAPSPAFGGAPFPGFNPANTYPPPTLVSSGASSSASFPVSASTPLASGAVSSSSTVFGSTPLASGASSASSVGLGSVPLASGASSASSVGLGSVPLASGASSFSFAVFASVPALQDERTLAECLRTQLGLTPHRASKLKARLVHWAHCGVSLQDGSLVALSPSLTLDLLLHPMQNTREPVVDDSVLKDILAAMRKAQFRSLGELGLFKTAPAPAPAPAPAVQQGHAAAGIDASCVLVSALLLHTRASTNAPAPPPPLQRDGLYFYTTLHSHKVDDHTRVEDGEKPVHVPLGWEIAPCDADSIRVCAAHPWQSTWLVFSNGDEYGTLMCSDSSHIGTTRRSSKFFKFFLTPDENRENMQRRPSYTGRARGESIF